MLPKTFSNTSLSDGASASSSLTRVHDFNNLIHIVPSSPEKQIKKKRNLPGNPEPDAEVIALSPRSLLATNRFVCEVCSKGFQRDQNLQLHRRGHNLPWKLQKRNNNGQFRKKVYVCPEPTCVHHSPSRALGDLTGIKKHFCRKHREKRLKCPKCSKMYAVESDYKAHSKVCGTRETRCDCGRIFSRKDKYEIHKPFCDALAKEAGKMCSTLTPSSNQHHGYELNVSNDSRSALDQQIQNFEIETPFFPELNLPRQLGFIEQQNMAPNASNTAYTPASAVLQQVTSLGAGSISDNAGQISRTSLGVVSSSPPLTITQYDVEGFGQVGPHLNDRKQAIWRNTDNLTRDFLGVTGEGRNEGGGGHVTNSDFLSLAGAVYFGKYGRDHLMLRAPSFGFVGDY